MLTSPTTAKIQRVWPAKRYPRIAAAGGLQRLGTESIADHSSLRTTPFRSVNATSVHSSMLRSCLLEDLGVRGTHA